MYHNYMAAPCGRRRRGRRTARRRRSPGRRSRPAAAASDVDNNNNNNNNDNNNGKIFIVIIIIIIIIIINHWPRARKGVLWSFFSPFFVFFSASLPMPSQPAIAGPGRPLPFLTISRSLLICIVSYKINIYNYY